MFCHAGLVEFRNRCLLLPETPIVVQNINNSIVQTGQTNQININNNNYYGGIDPGFSSDSDSEDGETPHDSEVELLKGNASCVCRVVSYDDDI